MTDLRQLDRRDFFKLTGIVSSGLLLGACNDELPAQAVPGDAFNPSLFISIERDGTVQLVTWRSEMGQGVRTSIPQLIADEMEADWERVRVVQAPADPRYGKQSTDGSVSIKMFWLPARQAGARARHLLETAAAQHWQVSTESCRAELHQVMHSPSGRKIGYGELVDIAKTLSIAEQFTPTLKIPAEFRYIGQSLPAYDLQAMTTGQAQYGIDMTLPGMLHACIRRCPVREGKVKSYDDSATRKFAQSPKSSSCPTSMGHQTSNPFPASRYWPPTAGVRSAAATRCSSSGRRVASAVTALSISPSCSN